MYLNPLLAAFQTMKLVSSFMERMSSNTRSYPTIPALARLKASSMICARFVSWNLSRSVSRHLAMFSQLCRS